ncbi:MAG: hypothetical protein UX09_C0024G0008 [Candidatus Uhrbacteria bacterium GW2011_GWE2_45_35]|nr:MAG: hypothetical protein UX09_C0024G0008 [Candidatus Uhrbacteria bacterium GW2011_GWE2_45_35]HBR81048.1 hypothetical protein [Candidatus Uhrbacteria bacterium]HCU32062.1 hypothetical protein [Candidatus Uhrbacteria bacterium]
MLDSHRGHNETGTVEPVKERKLSFREKLKREPLLICLERLTSDNSWTAERVARDVWQNFFDANGFTADGVTVDTKSNEDGTVTVTIRSAAEYPFNRLTTFGAGYKEDQKRSAGGKHEGSKIVNLTLLRDFGCSKVRYGSQDWEVEFYLDEPPEGQIDDQMEQQKAMYVKLSDRKPEVGNFFQVTCSPEMAKELIDGRDLFYHKSNPDFAHPDIDNDKVGCRILEEGENGNFYLNGQRVSVLIKDKWNTVEGFTFWTKETPTDLVLGRDRDVVNNYEFEEKFLNFFVRSLDDDEAILLFNCLENYFVITDDTKVWENYGLLLIRKLSERLGKTGYRHDFSDSMLASDGVDKETDRTLRSRDYVICDASLAKVGMKTGKEIIAEMRRLQEVEPNQQERRRVRLLEKIMQKFVNFIKIERGAKKTKEGLVIGRINFKRLTLFESTHPMQGGRYDEDEVWSSRALINKDGPFSSLAVYRHELCHIFGDDSSAAFSYALTDIMEDWDKFLVDNPGLLENLVKEWNKAAVTNEWWSVEEAKDKIESALRGLQSTWAKAEEASVVGAQKIGDLFLDLCNHQEKIGKKWDGKMVPEVFKRIYEDPDVMVFRRCLAGAANPDRDAVEKMTLLDKQLGEVEERIGRREKRIKKGVSAKDRRRLEVANQEDNNLLKTLVDQLNRFGEAAGDTEVFADRERDVMYGKFEVETRYSFGTELSNPKYFAAAVFEAAAYDEEEEEKKELTAEDTERLKGILRSFGDFIPDQKDLELVKLIILRRRWNNGNLADKRSLDILRLVYEDLTGAGQAETK